MAKFLIANDKGGVGKSLLAHFCVVALRGSNLSPRIVEYDRQPKLRRLFGNAVESHATGPDLAALESDPGAAARFWDPVLAMLAEPQPLVLDFGAQVWSGFSQWAQASNLATLAPGVGVTILVPVTADPEAVAGAVRVLEEAPMLLPQARLVLMVCDKDGQVASLAGTPDYDRMIALVQARQVPVRSLPVLRAEALPALAARGLRLDQIASSAGIDVQGIPPAALARTVTAVRAWMKGMYGALLPLMLQVPPKVVAAPAAPPAKRQSVGGALRGTGRAAPPARLVP